MSVVSSLALRSMAGGGQSMGVAVLGFVLMKTVSTNLSHKRLMSIQCQELHALLIHSKVYLPYFAHQYCQ